jgi:phosphohistidine phosphatase
MPPKLLELLRHAKSSWADPEIADHERPLNRRGRSAAALVGRHLCSEGPLPDLVLCSTAVRTRQTLELLDLADHVEVLFEDRLYAAGPGALLARLRMIPASVRTTLVIGHNPGLEELARILDRQSLSSVEKFPTAALALLRFPIKAWKELDRGQGHLDAFFTPRDLSATKD